MNSKGVQETVPEIYYNKKKKVIHIVGNIPTDNYFGNGLNFETIICPD
jgi:hypothetical protein